MTTPSVEEREAILTLCLMAAFADGQKDEEERRRLKSIFDGFGEDFSPALYNKVLLGQAQLNETAAMITTPTLRNLAYEMAVGVCDADGITQPEEQAFLDQLRAALTLDSTAAKTITTQGEALASIPLEAEASEIADLSLPEAAHSASDPTGRLREDPSVDPMILKYAILNGGLELLPQSLATMAIVPLQMKMAYRIGSHYGFQLDRGHIKEFLAMLGVGMSSQVLENYARKFVGGFFKMTMGKKTGKKLGKVAGAATGALMSFATTYALGHVAKLYYSGGRQLQPEALKQLYRDQLEQGKLLYESYKPQVENSAKTTDLNSLLDAVRRPSL